VHGRRPFFAMADVEENARRKTAGKKEIPLSPIAITPSLRMARSPLEQCRRKRAEKDHSRPKTMAILWV
jgi:hypothetical protein